MTEICGVLGDVPFGGIPTFFSLYLGISQLLSIGLSTTFAATLTTTDREFHETFTVPFFWPADASLMGTVTISTTNLFCDSITTDLTESVAQSNPCESVTDTFSGRQFFMVKDACAAWYFGTSPKSSFVGEI